MKNFNITRVVSKDFVTDTFQGLRNMFGMRLRGYEALLNKQIGETIAQAEAQYNIEWYRLSINPLTTGSVMITIYGMGEEYE